MPITRLTDHVINLIAAGEVVERPVAVIRELIDNSLDAAATKIAIEVIDGGLELLRVTDNGVGMDEADALLAFERHATSKLLNPKDLEIITTLGFRGEALASIAAVSRVRLLTKQLSAALATEITLSAGSEQQVTECAAANGTTLEVRGLFFNQPARKKFMKLPRTELARIRNHLHALALVTPHVHFTLKADGKELDNFSPATSVHSRARALFGDGLIPVSAIGEVMRVEGAVTHPGAAITSTRQKTAAITIVNGRVVQDRMILRAVREGYDSMLKSYELPGGFIAISMRPDLVDVNVHPQKSEVRFRDSSAVFVAVRNAVKAALGSSLLSLNQPKALTQDLALGEEAAQLNSIAANGEFRRPVVFGHQTELKISPQRDFSGFISRAREPILSAVKSEVHSTAPSYSINVDSEFSTAAPACGSFSQIRLIGQALGCYLLGEDDSGIIAIDMHAAHERINFNLIRARMAERAMPVQELLFPVSVSLTEEQRAALDERAEYFAAFGFRWQGGAAASFADGNSVSLLSAPAFFSPERLSDILKLALEVCVKHDHAQPLEALIDAIAARVACHASIRGGDKLSEKESYALLSELDKTENGGACPHGRPVLRRFSRSDVERWFGRDK